jgi:hypothetical protein
LAKIKIALTLYDNFSSTVEISGTKWDIKIVMNGQQVFGRWWSWLTPRDQDEYESVLREK